MTGHQGKKSLEWERQRRSRFPVGPAVGWVHLVGECEGAPSPSRPVLRGRPRASEPGSLVFLDLRVGRGVGPAVAGGDADCFGVGAHNFAPLTANFHPVALLDRVAAVASRLAHGDLRGSNGFPVGVLVGELSQLGAVPVQKGWLVNSSNIRR